MMEPQSEPFDLGPLITTKLAWDMVAHFEILTFLPSIGFTPPSEEGVESEHIESHQRKLVYGPLTELVNKMCARAAGIYTVFKVGTEESETEEFAGLMEQNTEVLQCGTAAILAQLLEMQVIQFGPGIQKVLHS